MKVNVILKTEQIFEDHTEKDEHICDGEIQYLEKGAVLEFIEKVNEQEVQLRMDIVEGKVVLHRYNKTMVLDYNYDDNCDVVTPYGEMKMKIHTTNIKITYEQELIKEILLEYDIRLENNMQYAHKVIAEIEYC